ncbi:hypothetical protein ACFVU3_14535 [Streptomyces sp. NPDC058052]|uniref:hypothetical protein n=1 Tax=Streptomyces sp. NPDC058052 TaxID=3346316 RepID=UPI0036E268F5
MSREDRWVVISSGLSMAVWVAQVWIVLDTDLQGIQEAIGWWMIAIAIAPVLLTAVGVAVLDEPRDGEPVSWADDDDRPKPGPRGLESCGGCGG